MIKYGNFGLLISGWVWYLAFENFYLVVLSKIISTIFGPMTSVTLLTVSNRWFPEHQRSKATAAGSFIGLLGAAAAVLVGPQFETGTRIVDFNLKSCQIDKVSENTINNYYESLSNNLTLDCELTQNFTDAFEAFCCYTPANIPLYNLILAILLTFSFIFSVIVIKNEPDTPPSIAAEPKEHISLYKSMKMLLIDNKSIRTITLADLFISGPPFVLFQTVARILPVEVAHLDLVMSGKKYIYLKKKKFYNNIKYIYVYIK